MAPRQNTFTIIPNAVGLNTINQGALAPGVSAKPPMTSKQAKKLYNQANRQPKLSKAEQRRRDLIEQDRIRKEFEEESRRARARTARERKKLKEEERRDEKRKKGLPLVSVNPSQDTISRFIKCHGGGKKREVLASTDGPTTTGETAEPPHGSGRCLENRFSQRIDGAQLGADDLADGGEGTNLHDAEAPAVKRRRVNEQPSPNRPPHVLQASQGEGQELAADGSFSIDASAVTDRVADTADVPASVGRAAKQDHPSPSASCQQQMGRTTPREALREVSGNTERRGDKPRHTSSHSKQPPQCDILRGSPGTARQRLLMPEKTAQPEGVAPPARASPHEETASIGKPQQDGPRQCSQGSRRSPVHTTMTPVAPYASAAYASAAKSSQATRAGSMGPPPVPPRFKTPAVARKDGSDRPKFLSRHSQPPASPRSAEEMNKKRLPSERHCQPNDDFLPTNTQLFVLNHVDDLFPTPSQEAQELEDISPPTPPAAARAATPRCVPSKPDIGLTRTINPPAELPDAQQVPSLPIPFFSSQDFVLSSQDIREVEDNTTTPSRAQPGCHTGTIRAARPAKKTADRAMPDIERAACKLGSPHDKPSHPAPGSTISTTPQRPTRQSGIFDQDAKGYAKHCYPSRSSSRSSRTFSACRGPPRQHPSSPSGTAQQHSPVPVSQPRSETDARGSAQRSVEQTGAQGSQPRKRFFTSSGGGAVTLVAQERSLRSLAQEKRRREIQQREEARREIAEQARRGPLTMRPGEEAAEEDLLGDDLDGITEEDLLHVIETPATPASTGCANSQHKLLRRSVSNLSPGSRGGQDGSDNLPIPQSQETDYGDIDIGDGEDLDFLWN